MNNQNELPEAKSSVTYSLESPTGYNCLFTIRDTSGTALLNTMGKIEEELTKRGYKPQAKRAGFVKKEPEYSENDCPKCGARVVLGTTKDGKRFEKCETNKFDFKTKRSTGCPYFSYI